MKIHCITLTCSHFDDCDDTEDVRREDDIDRRGDGFHHHGDDSDRGADGMAFRETTSASSSIEAAKEFDVVFLSHYVRRK